jgi:multidrug efflux pump
MAQFFIGRPIFAWVVAIFIMLAGVLAIPQLPVSQYPKVAPPTVSINTSYPGAAPEDVYQSVTRPIEQELNSVEGMLYFESTSDAAGSVSITVTFAPGTDCRRSSRSRASRSRRLAPASLCWWLSSPKMEKPTP